MRSDEFPSPKRKQVLATAGAREARVRTTLGRIPKCIGLYKLSPSFRWQRKARFMAQFRLRNCSMHLEMPNSLFPGN